MKVTLSNIFREQKTSAAGKPYTSVRIKTQEHGDKQLSGFGNAGNKDWKEGDTVEINVTEKVSNGRTFLNFENPKPQSGPDMKNVEVRLAFISHKVDECHEMLTRLSKKAGTLSAVEEARSTPAMTPNFDPSPEDINSALDSLSEEEIPW